MTVWSFQVFPGYSHVLILSYKLLNQHISFQGRKHMRFITERCNVGQNNITMMPKFSYLVVEYKSQVQWYIWVIPGQGRPRQKDQKFKIILIFMTKSQTRLGWMRPQKIKEGGVETTFQLFKSIVNPVKNVLQCSHQLHICQIHIQTCALCHGTQDLLFKLLNVSFQYVNLLQHCLTFLSLYCFPTGPLEFS